MNNSDEKKERLRRALKKNPEMARQLLGATMGWRRGLAEEMARRARGEKAKDEPIEEAILDALEEESEPK